MYEITAPLFCDASGDGVVGFSFRAPLPYGGLKAERSLAKSLHRQRIMVNFWDTVYISTQRILASRLNM